IARVTRTSMLEVMKQDYIRTAFAKGISYPRIIFFHAFRNALIPIMTILGNDFGVLLTGSMITENVFNIPGIGKLLIDAINRRDIPLVQGGVIYVAAICVLVYFVVDILYAIVNPNIRLTKEVN
ncbi:MAG: ABC transporter permease, partial [Solobacterium sp.]|nr:ABC transporter permease [Solobacterium sp.]